MASVSYHIANLLEKMTSADKDFRFMATNDLMSELQKDSIKLDDDSERKVVRMLLKLLEDKNGEVQNLAVKCLGPLVNKVKETQVESIVDALCTNMVSDNEQLRDVSSVGLKTVISELPPSSNPLTSNVCRRVTPRLVGAIHGRTTTASTVPHSNDQQQQQNVDVAIQLEGLDILADLLLRYGGLLAQYHATIEEALMPLLASSRLAVRKRAIVALAHLVAVCSQPLFNTVCDYLFDVLEKNQSLSTTRTYVACVGAVSRAAGPRFGPFLPKFIPIMVKYCEQFDDDELREGCLQSFESILLRCPKEATPYVVQITDLCSKYLCHDPNYHYDEDDADDSMEVENSENGDMETDGDGHDEDQSDDEAQEYSDDDDMSWKVRRASAKCLEAILSTRREMLAEFYRGPAPLLISRFKEREENVKADIFKAYNALLKHTKLVVPAGDPEHDDTGLLILLKAQLPQLIKAVTKQLKEKSLKTRQSCFALLTELLRVYPGCLSADYYGLLLPGVQHALTDKQANSNMKIDTLIFVGAALSGHPAKTFQRYVPQLVPLVVSAVEDPFYKVTAEALSVVQQLIRILRPPDTPSSSFDFTPHVAKLYAAVYTKLKATDIDQEVKERAITCVGYMLASFGDYLQAELPVCLPLLLDRLKNEITRLTTVRALTVIGQSPLKIPLASILPSVVSDLAEFLRKNQRALRISTLQLLETLNTNYQSSITPAMLKKVLIELPALIVETDLQIAQMTLALLTIMLKFQPSAVAEFIDPILSSIARLIQSPLLQGVSLNSLCEFLLQLIQSGLSRPSFEELKTMLTKPIYDSHTAANTHKQYFHSAAKCLATLVAARPQEAPVVVSKFMSNLTSQGVDQQIQLFSLLALGEIGRKSPKSIAETSPPIDQVIMRGFQSSNEEVKTAASLALGGVAVGNLEKYLPIVLKEIETQPKRQYLLLHALKEIISSESTMMEVESVSAIFKPHIDQIWMVLLSHSGCNEEGVRNVVAECLGKLCLLEPERLLPKLKGHLMGNDNPFVRATVVTAVKFTIVDQPQPVDNLLKACIGEFLQTLTDPDLNVRRVALVTFNSAAHNKPSLVKGDILATVLPHVYGETKVRRELIREVEMGPFKHTVDDGLDLRKAAFECMYTLLDTCLERLDIFEFLSHVEDGLKDHYDIKMLTYLMLIRLATLCPTQTLQRLDRLVEPLKQTCVQKVKANSVKQEYEKQDELKRCALRAICALQVIPDADKSPQLLELMSMIRTTQDLASLYESVQKDPISGHHRYGYDSAGASGAQAMEVDSNY